MNMNEIDELLKLTEKDFPGVEMWIVGAMRSVCLRARKLEARVEKLEEALKYYGGLSATILFEGGLANQPPKIEEQEWDIGERARRALEE